MIKRPVRYRERENLVVDADGKAVCEVLEYIEVGKGECDRRGAEIVEWLNYEPKTNISEPNNITSVQDVEVKVEEKGGVVSEMVKKLRGWPKGRARK